MNKILILSIAALIGAHAYADEKTSPVAAPLRLNREPESEMRVCAANAQQLNQRLRVLLSELKTGEAELRDLEQKEAQLRQTLVRTKEAIRLIEEELAKAGT
jgi:septal ring factor EnvC (AmiA/AmiB activator)